MFDDDENDATRFMAPEAASSVNDLGAFVIASLDPSVFWASAETLVAHGLDILLRSVVSGERLETGCQRA